jgi:hypothetical protein
MKSYYVSSRTRYSNHVKDQVRKRYPLCRTTADKETLAEELGIGSVTKLYNLASRLRATGKEEDTDQRPDYLTEAHGATRLLMREDPKTTTFSNEADRYLKSEFGRRTVEAISYHLRHSETAILYRARQLGLRKPVKYWNAKKVAAWLGLSERELREELVNEGVDIYPLGDRNGRLVLRVVSTSSLARWLSNNINLLRVQEANADAFFLQEILESTEELSDGKTTFESCKFLSHGHVCQNPFTENSFGLFCSNNERYQAGEDPRCTVRHLDIEDVRPQN